ncbi:cupin domain-containing protein [Devosia sp.]|uniref:cupin domain-containing protein n=1 Tax=Devosia sp. TaxID=1871048 RepID=UPI002EDD2014
MKRGLALALACACAATAVQAQEQASQQYRSLLTPLLESATDILGTPLDYPDGPAKVTAAVVTLPPGGETGWHEHEVPLFGYILEGELTIDYASKGTKTYRAGDSFLEAVDWPHNGSNTGETPVRLIAVYMGGGGEANSVAVEAP